ncbi:MAG TPA: hypothetical protein VIH45_12875 [Desulfuromonadaceae bacterium]
MSCFERVLRPFDYSGIDAQIEKFRRLAAEYRQDNMAYYGEYLSSILFGDEYPDAGATGSEERPGR